MKDFKGNKNPGIRNYYFCPLSDDLRTLEVTTFRKLHMFAFSGEERRSPYWVRYEQLTPVTGLKRHFTSVFRISVTGQSPKTH
jgi:hypothetical protein